MSIVYCPVSLSHNVCIKCDTPFVGWLVGCLREKGKKIKFKFGTASKIAANFRISQFPKEETEIVFWSLSLPLHSLHSFSHTFSLVLSTNNNSSDKRENRKKGKKKKIFFSLIPNNNIERVSRHCNI